MATSRREQFTVRIDRGTGSVPAGVGFLLGKRQILTCAHVVNTALGRPARSQERPADGDLVTVRFSLLDGLADRPLRARVLSWAPPLTDGLIGGDVAALTLLDEPPEGSDRARLFRGEVREQGVELYGFPGNPPRRENGAWASGTLRGRVGRGALQIDRATESALRAQPGYSGGPVIVAGGPGQQGDTVAGMIVVAGKDDGSNDAYAVGIHHLSEFWSDCFTLGTHPEASASARAMSTERLRRLLEASARECELILGPQIQAHAKYAEYLEAFDQRHPHGLLGIWGKSGIFRATYVSALSSTHLLVRGDAKTLRRIPYEALPDYEIFAWTQMTRRGVHLDRGVYFLTDPQQPAHPENLRVLGSGLSRSSRQPMVKVLTTLSALALGEPEPTGEGPPARVRYYLLPGFQVR